MAGDWRDRVACTPAQAQLFDELAGSERRGDRGGVRGAARIAEATAICNGCDVWMECLEEAISSQASGVRGRVYLENGEVMHVVTVRDDHRASIVQAGAR